MIHATVSVALGCQLGAHQVQTRVKTLCAGQQMCRDGMEGNGCGVAARGSPCSASHWDACDIFLRSKLAFCGAGCCFGYQCVMQVVLLMVFPEMEGSVGLI